MPRAPRIQPGGYVFHVLNRGNARRTIFAKPGDYAAFERIMAEAGEHVPIRLLAYCLMPNHWHLVLQPHRDGDLGRYIHRLTTTHVRRWHAHQHTEGHGHLYQGAYKSFPVQDDDHLLMLCRYVEANALRAGLLPDGGRAEDWTWCSAWRRDHPQITEGKPALCDWPVTRPTQWRRILNLPQPQKQQDAIQTALRRGRPLGQEAWRQATARHLRLTHTLRPRGRPPKAAT